MPDCAECKRLQGEHAEAITTHTQLQVQLRGAVEQSKGEVVTNLILSVAAALRARDDAQVQLWRHEAGAHGGGKAEGEPA